MVIIWSGIECLVKAPMTGLRRGLRSRIAMILGWQDWEVGLKKDKKGKYKTKKKKQKFGELDKAPF